MLSGVTWYGALQNPKLRVVIRILHKFFKNIKDYFKQFYFYDYNEFVIVQLFSFRPNIQMSLGHLFHQFFNYS